MAEILLLSVPAFGHVQPMLAIARSLVEGGHRVRWLAGVAFRERIEATGALFAPMRHGLDYSTPDGVPEGLAERRQALKGAAQLRFDLETFFVTPSGGYCADLLTLHRQCPADLVVCDSFLMAGAWWSERTGRPWVQLCCSVLTLPSRALAPFGMALPPDDSLLGRGRNALLRLLSRSLLLRSLRRSADTARAALDLPARRPWLFDVVSPDLVISGTVPGFEHPRPDLPAQVVFVGPLLVAPETDTPLPPWWDELDRAEVVLVSQGTVSNDPAQLLRPTLEALAEEPVLVVVTTGRAEGGLEGLGPLPANARAAAFIPYPRLMDKVSVFVTNGGFQGVQAALSAGVPMVSAGSSEDKPEVCSRLRRCGAGLDLGTATPTPEAIRSAVRRVLAEPSFREAARTLAVQCRAGGGAEAAARRIERVLQQHAGPRPAGRGPA